MCRLVAGNTFTYCERNRDWTRSSRRTLICLNIPSRGRRMKLVSLQSVRLWSLSLFLRMVGKCTHFISFQKTFFLRVFHSRKLGVSIYGSTDFFPQYQKSMGWTVDLKRVFFQNQVNYFKLRTYSFGSGCHDHRSPSTVVLVGDKQIVAWAADRMYINLSMIYPLAFQRSTFNRRIQQLTGKKEPEPAAAKLHSDRQSGKQGMSIQRSW